MISINNAYVHKFDTSVYKVYQFWISYSELAVLIYLTGFDDICKRQFLTNNPKLSYLRKKKGKILVRRNLYYI